MIKFRIDSKTLESRRSEFESVIQFQCTGHRLDQLSGMTHFSLKKKHVECFKVCGSHAFSMFLYDLMHDPEKTDYFTLMAQKTRVASK